MSSWFESFEPSRRGLKSCSIPASLKQLPPEQPKPTPSDCEGLTIRSASFLGGYSASPLDLEIIMSSARSTAERLVQREDFRNYHLFWNQIVMHESFEMISSLAPPGVCEAVRRVTQSVDHGEPSHEEIEAIRALRHGERYKSEDQEERPSWRSWAMGVPPVDSKTTGVARAFQEYVFQPAALSRGLACEFNQQIKRDAMPRNAGATSPLPQVLSNTTIGYSPTSFPSSKFTSIGVTGVAYPFLTATYKCHGCQSITSLWVMDNQCAVACSAFSNLIALLNRQPAGYGLELPLLDTTTFAFSTNGSESHLLVAWRMDLEGEPPSYHVAEVDSFLLKYDYRKVRNILLNILDWGQEREESFITSFLGSSSSRDSRQVTRNLELGPQQASY